MAVHGFLRTRRVLTRRASAPPVACSPPLLWRERRTLAAQAALAGRRLSSFPKARHDASRSVVLRRVAHTFVLPAGSAASLLRVEEMVGLTRQPDFNEDVAATYLADCGIDLEVLERAWSATGAMANDELDKMFGLFTTVSIGKPKPL